MFISKYRLDWAPVSPAPAVMPLLITIKSFNARAQM